MTTLTFNLKTDEQLAASYRNAQPTDKQRIKSWLQQFLERILHQDQARLAFYSALDNLHAEAEANGLTDAVIDELLADES